MGMPIAIKVNKGERYGHWTILKEDGHFTHPSGHRTRAFLCRCDCGTERRIRLSNLRSGITKSCDCPEYSARRKHGHASPTMGGGLSPTYISWVAMKNRCKNKNHPRYARYGGRGVTITPRWSKFENFLEDMGERPEGLTLDRIDNEMGYCKENCQWSSYKEQAMNRSSNLDYAI